MKVWVIAMTSAMGLDIRSGKRKGHFECEVVHGPVMANRNFRKKRRTPYQTRQWKDTIVGRLTYRFSVVMNSEVS